MMSNRGIESNFRASGWHHPLWLVQYTTIVKCEMDRKSTKTQFVISTIKTHLLAICYATGRQTQVSLRSVDAWVLLYHDIPDESAHFDFVYTIKSVWDEFCTTTLDSRMMNNSIMLMTFVLLTHKRLISMMESTLTGISAR